MALYLEKTQREYSTDVFDLEPVLIQPAYIQCAEPSDKEIVQALKSLDEEQKK